MATLTRTFIFWWLNHLIPSSISCQAQSPYLPHCGGVDVHFSGAVDCFRQIVKAQGILGLWNGLTANLLKVKGVVSLSCFSASSTSTCSYAGPPYSLHGNAPSSTDGSTRPMTTDWQSALKRGDPVQCLASDTPSQRSWAFSVEFPNMEGSWTPKGNLTPHLKIVLKNVYICAYVLLSGERIHSFHHIPKELQDQKKRLRTLD